MAERVVFLRPDAERIAKAVRRVEGLREGGPLRFGRSIEDLPRKTFRVGTFTGAWPTGTLNTVTFKYQTNTPNTVSALNLFFPVANTASDTRDCAVAKEGTAWFLIDVPFYTATAVFARETAQEVLVRGNATTEQTIVSACGSTSQATVVSGITIAAVLNTNDCTITVSQTAQTQSLTLSTGGCSTSKVIVLSSTGATTAITFLTSTYTSSFVRLEP